MVYIARRTQGKAAFLAPLTPCGQQKGAKRQFSPIFVDFDQKAQKLHQNKPGIDIAHRFYIEKGITGVLSREGFFLPTRKVFVLCHTWRLGMIPLAMTIMNRVLL